jgi:hypothetical protein
VPAAAIQVGIAGAAPQTLRDARFDEVGRIRKFRTSSATNGFVTCLHGRGVGAAIGRGERALTRHLLRGVFARSTTEHTQEDEGDEEAT